MQLFEHQKRILEDDPAKCGLFLGTGGGKTLTGLLLARGTTLILVEKQQKLDRTWELNAEKFGLDVDMYVMTKEEFRKEWHKLGDYETVIVDECHNFLGVQPDTKTVQGIPIPKTSQLFDGLYKYLKKYPPKRFYLASATPVSKPMNMYAIGLLLGKNWDYFLFREKYYFQKQKGYRVMWIPKKNKALRDRLAEVTKSFGYTGQLNDWFDVPEQTHITKKFELTKEQKEAIFELEQNEADPMVLRTKKRAIENGVQYVQSPFQIDAKTMGMKRTAIHYKNEKIEYILSKAQEFPKMLVFANYTAQVEAIADALRAEGYKVMTLTGQTKNRSEVVKQAQKEKECIVVAQCAVSAGYELPDFPVCIFASKSHRYLDYEQGKGRILRANHIKKNLYISLVVADGIDEDCHESIMTGQDFHEKVMDNS